MLKTGVVSISFRNRSAEEIATYAKKANLLGVEWGSDIHVPAGDTEKAKNVRKLCDKNSLKTFSYGSYYKLGENPNPKTDFLPYLLCALCLNAPVIRVWAGTKGSEKVTQKEYEKILHDLKTICNMAQEKNIIIALEYHPNTITDNAKSALKLIEGVNSKNLKLYWQPDFKKTHEVILSELKMVADHVLYVHTFYWDKNGKRLALIDGKNVWIEFKNIILEKNKDAVFLLEFVANDEIKSLKTEADFLCKILEA